jgi:hypothetical protein
MRQILKQALKENGYSLKQIQGEGLKQIRMQVSSNNT